MNILKLNYNLYSIVIIMDQKQNKGFAANSFKLNIDLYFWMIDRGDF